MIGDPTSVAELKCGIAKHNTMPNTEQLHAEDIDLNGTAEGERLDFTSFLDDAVKDVKLLVRTQKELLVLDAADKAASLSAKLIQSAIKAFTALFVLLFLNIALAFYLAEVLDSTPLGFVCAAASYALLGLAFNLYWTSGGKDRFLIDRINDFTDGE